MSQVRHLFRPWMRLVIHAQQMLHRKLGVTLRGREALVPEHLLDSAQIGTFFEHVGAEGVPQRVRVNVGRQSFRDCNFFNDPADAARRQSPSPLIDEERGSAFARLNQNCLTRGQIRGQR